MSDISIFSKRLRSEREKLGLKQKEMAEKLNMPSNTYNGYETGKRLPALDIARDIADALNVTTDYLLGRSNKRNSPNIEEIQKESNKEIEYIEKAISRLNDIGKKEAVKRISELTEINKYTTPVTIAAHNDNTDNEQLELMNQDIDEL